jgi:L-threonylcarbamoyladenylate synthase
MKISIQEAASLIKSGKVVAIPTETVFGLSASIYHEPAIEMIFQLKNRPLSNPLILHISDLDQIVDLIEEEAIEEIKPLIQKFWPGSLTIVLPLKKEARLPRSITAGLNTVAIRMPDLDNTLQLINQTGPLVAPSANRSGYPSGTKLEHVEQDFGIDFPVMEGESTCKGIESTIIAKEQGVWKIAREGAIVPSDLEPILGYLPLTLSKKEKPICPGQHFRHYSPHAKLLPMSYHKLKDVEDVVIGFVDRQYPKATHLIPLGSSSHPEEIQKNLYSAFRSIDQLGFHQAYIDTDLPKTERMEILKRRIEKAVNK